MSAAEIAKEIIKVGQKRASGLVLILDEFTLRTIIEEGLSETQREKNQQGVALDRDR